MNSPPYDTGSPMVSTPSSTSPPPEETGLGYMPSSSQTSHLLDMVSSSLSPSSSKRRLLGGNTSKTRDTKSRRREDSRKGTVPTAWDTNAKDKKEKEDLIDVGLVEQLRKEIGDPFVENATY